MNKKIRDILFFLIIFGLIFNSVPKALQIPWIAGPLGGKLVFFPLIVGMIYSFYCKYKFAVDFSIADSAKQYMSLYVLVNTVSLVVGLITYSYYDQVLAGPFDQISNITRVLNFFHSVGVDVDKEILLSIFMFLKPIKNLVLEFVYNFGGAYMIYCWYKDDWKLAFDILCKSILCSLFIVFLYSFLEVFYLSGNELARNILEKITPYIHVVKVNHGWWPPLLWKGQIRSVFAEPSFFSIWAAFALPFVWYKIFNNKSCIVIYPIVLIFFTFLIFMTKARTGVALLCGELALLSLYTMYVRKKEKLKLFGIIFLCTLIAFGVSNLFINQYLTKGSSITVSNYLKDNLGSIASTNKRSNTARYSTIIANVKIGLDNPILGVGKGLTPAYMPEYFPEMSKNNWEVKNWIKYQNEQGILKMGIPSFSAYSLIFAETGFLGLVLYMLPSFVLVISLCKKIYMQECLFLLISLLGILASGFSNTLNITYCYWVLLGLGYAMCFGKESCVHDDE